MATTSAPKSQALAQQAIENVKAASHSSNVATPQNPAKAAKLKAVEAMKMRRKAEPANPRDSAASVPMDKRLFVTVSNGTTEKILWVKKVTINHDDFTRFVISVTRRRAQEKPSIYSLQSSVYLPRRFVSPLSIVASQTKQSFIAIASARWEYS